MFGHDSEKQMAKRLRDGDAKAMREFYALYAGRLTAVCSRYVANREDVKDVMQDTMLAIIRGIDGFEWRGSGSLLAWATRVAVSQAVAFLRKNARLDTASLDRDVEDLPEGEPQANDLPPDALHAMLRELPDGYRAVFNLYAVEGRSHKEIAELLGIKPDTSASQYHRAKALMAHKINEYRKHHNLPS